VSLDASLDALKLTDIFLASADGASGKIVTLQSLAVLATNAPRRRATNRLLTGGSQVRVLPGEPIMANNSLV
jgi:hypothetical protein